MPQITLNDVQEQVKKACQIYKQLPEPKPGNMHSCLSNITLPHPIFSKTPQKMTTPQEVDMADIVYFDWFSWLLPDERRILCKRYEGMPWKVLAYNEGLSIRQARYKVQKSLEKILTKLIKKHKIQ